MLATLIRSRLISAALMGVFIFVIALPTTTSSFAGAQETESKPESTANEQEDPKPDEKDGKAEEITDEANQDTKEKNEEGQADLDKAFQLKITASSTRDLDKVADLCESAIENGLPRESEEQAKDLWASVLIDHAQRLNRRIAPRGQLSTRWRWLRSQAISRLDKAVELRPGKIDALILLAKLHSLNAGDKEAAMEAIEKAIAQLTDDKKKLSEALFIRARLADDEEMRLADLTQAVKIDPTNFEAIMERAVYYLGKDKKEEAMADFKAVVQIDNENTDRFILIAEALRRRRMLEQSIQILDLGVAANPENGDLYLLRGQAHLQSKNDDKALEDLNKALEIDRQNTDALNLRARVFLVKEDYDKALKDANELIQQKPDDVGGFELRSLIFRSQDKFDNAIEDIKSLLELVPGNLDYKFDLAILHNINEQPSKAIKLFDEIVRKARDEVQSRVLRNRGDAYLSLGEHQRAIDDYELAIELMDEFSGSQSDGMSDEREKDMKSGLLNNLSWVLSTSPKDEVRDGERAIELATEAAELTDYKAAFILSTLAAGYAETGDFEAARKWAAKAVELAESDEQRKGLQDELDFYKEDKAWRETENVEEDNKDESKQDESAEKKSGKDEEADNSDDQKEESDSDDGTDSDDDGKEEASDDEDG